MGPSEIQILQSYADGEISRGRAMAALGLDWYGDLLTAMNAAVIVRAPLPADVLAEMDKSIAAVLGSCASF